MDINHLVMLQIVFRRLFFQKIFCRITWQWGKSGLRNETNLMETVLDSQLKLV